MKKSLVLLFLLLPSIFCCSSNSLPSKSFNITKKDGSQISIKAEIAREEKDRNRGFMERKNIPDGTGMLFVFEKDQILSFWMKNTPTPLSIAYIDSQGRIRDIFNMKPFSLASIVSTVSVRYALEVPEGWFKRSGIKVGDVIDLSDLQK